MHSVLASKIGTGIGGLGNKRTSGDHPKYSIVEIGQNTEKSPEDLNSSKKPSANAQKSKSVHLE